MSKTIIRLNSENILDLDIDTRNHTLSGNIIDEVNNTLYPVGGGGGIPFCTINFVNNGNDAVYPVDYANADFGLGYFEYNDSGYISDYISIPANSSGTYNMLYSEVNDNFAIVNFNSSVTISDLVNCEEDGGAIYVTDPSLPSSFTATIA